MKADNSECDREEKTNKTSKETSVAGSSKDVNIYRVFQLKIHENQKCFGANLRKFSPNLVFNDPVLTKTSLASSYTLPNVWSVM